MEQVVKERYLPWDVLGFSCCEEEGKILEQNNHFPADDNSCFNECESWFILGFNNQEELRLYQLRDEQVTARIKKRATANRRPPVDKHEPGHHGIHPAFLIFMQWFKDCLTKEQQREIYNVEDSVIGLTSPHPFARGKLPSAFGHWLYHEIPREKIPEMVVDDPKDMDLQPFATFGGGEYSTERKVRLPSGVVITAGKTGEEKRYANLKYVSELYLQLQFSYEGSNLSQDSLALGRSFVASELHWRGYVSKSYWRYRWRSELLPEWLFEQCYAHQPIMKFHFTDLY